MDEVTEGTQEVLDQPVVTEDAPEGTSVEQVESFTDIDPTEAPEGDITNEWLQERYKQMQADYTRKRQADSETAKQRAEELEFLESLRSDKDTQQAVLEQLQELLAEQTDETELATEADPAAELRTQVEQLRAAEEQRQASALSSAIVSHVEQLAKDSGVELDEDDLKDIFSRATAGDQVNQDVTSAAFKAWNDRRQALHTKWQKSYLDSKTAPTQVPAGTSAQETPDLSKHENRVARMAAILSGNG